MGSYLEVGWRWGAQMSVRWHANGKLERKDNSAFQKPLTLPYCEQLKLILEISVQLGLLFPTFLVVRLGHI